MRILFGIFMVSAMLLLSSCEKCVVCTAEKNGIIHETEKCTSGSGSAKVTINSEKEKLQAEGYSNVNCVYR
jgi:hypothetical protein